MSEGETQHYDHSYDVVVVGSGAAAFCAAMGAVDAGLSVLMVEGTDKWGGSTAMSGGGLWLPNNPLMARDKVGDSREEALAYMEATIGAEGRASTRERKEAFVDGVGDFVTTAERFGMVFARATDYPDYYPELPGGKIGRAIEVKPLDSKILGEWWDTLRGAVPLPAMTDDVWLLGRAWSTPAGFARGAKVVARAAGGAVTGKRLVGIGNALATALCKAVVIDRNVPLWLNSPLTGLLSDPGVPAGPRSEVSAAVGQDDDAAGQEGRVTGIQITRDGRPLTIQARYGVVLATGGFESNPAWRRKYHGIDGCPSGNPGNVGTGIEIAKGIGAALELMDEAWWGASVAPVAGSSPSFIVGERSMPFTLMIDDAGDRFANESESYVDLGHHMLAHNKDGAYWLVADARNAHRYLRTFAIDPRVNKAMRAEGIMVKNATLAGLAQRPPMRTEQARAMLGVRERN
jgi:3-oxosteroid 1-dehydrogenase